MGTWVTKTQKYFCRKRVKMAHLGRTKVTVICYEVTVICYGLVAYRKETR